MTGEGIVRGPERVAESRSGKAVVCCYLLPGFRFFWGLCKINIPPLTLGMLEDFFFFPAAGSYVSFLMENSITLKIALLAVGCTKIIICLSPISFNYTSHQVEASSE